MNQSNSQWGKKTALSWWNGFNALYPTTTNRQTNLSWWGWCHPGGSLPYRRPQLVHEQSCSGWTGSRRRSSPHWTCGWKRGGHPPPMLSPTRSPWSLQAAAAINKFIILTQFSPSAEGVWDIYHGLVQHLLLTNHWSMLSYNLLGVTVALAGFAKQVLFLLINWWTMAWTSIQHTI